MSSVGSADLRDMLKELLEDQMTARREYFRRLSDLADAFGEFAEANTKATVEHVRRSTDAVMKTAGIPEDVRNSVAAVTENFQRVLLSAALVHPNEVKKVAEVGLKTIDKIGQSMRKTG